MYSLQCTFGNGGPKLPDLEEGAATHLYRIAQEATTNAARYARARKIAIDLRSTGRKLQLSIADDDSELLRPGKRVKGAILVERRAGRLVAPVSAVRTGASGPFVYRKTLFGDEPRTVELGRRGRDMIEILAGLEAGDRVQISP